MPRLRLPSRLLLAPALTLFTAFGCDRTPPGPPTPPAASGSEAAAAATASGAEIAPAAPSVSAAPPLRWTDAAPEVTPPLQAIAGATLVGGRSYALLRELTDGYGPRLTGSPVYAGAARWALEAFRTMGVDDVRLEEFDLAAGWERGPVTLSTVEPQARALKAEAVGWAPSPPGGSLSAEVVRIDHLNDVKAGGRALAGKAVLSLGKRGGPRGFAARQKALQALKDAGVAALLSRARRYNNAGNAHACFGCASATAPLPMVELGLEDGAWLERRLEEGKVTINLTNASRLTGPVKVANVVAEVRGRERPDEYVLASAHLDAWDFGTGAQDDGAGVAQVLEAARAVLAAGPRPRRSIRFALWAGEEQGLYGSRAYVKAHAGELDRLVAVVNADHGAGAPRGFWLDARPDLVERLGPLARRLFAGLGAGELKDEFHCDTDHCPFVLEGVPTFNLEVDDKIYDDVHHAPSDTFDKVREADLAAGAACVATAAYALADLPERVGPRLSHDKVTENLKAKGALDELVAEGLYKP
ncbi:MAG TPA: M20/M25/M40 family metallo-hydrolase [Polyangiaceae bacterium]|nr:M20/M25/M40 family metallo-hydrolase [Polyangiaceae bacterium]